MTTTVKVTAHCDSLNTEVVVGVAHVTDAMPLNISQDLSEIKILQDGESHELHAYDSRVIVVAERPKLED